MYVVVRALTVTIIHQFSSKCVQTFFSVIAWPKEFKTVTPNLDFWAARSNNSGNISIFFPVW